MPVDDSEIRAAYLELKFAGDGLEKDLRDGLKAAGDGAAQAVRDAASWSSRIPAATRTRVSFSGRGSSISVVTSAKAAPEARPLNNGGNSGMFRHPVYGRGDRTREEWTWVDQKAQPFFNAAGDAPAIDEQVQAVLDHVAFHAGFK